jgi:hypothetical protein
MDPLLEDPAVFPDLHSSLITYLRESLNQKLPPRYFAVANTRVWFEHAERVVEPDVDVLDARRLSGEQGGLAVLDAVGTQPVVIQVPMDEFREPYLDIFTEHAGKRLVTSLEILSRTNKTSGSQGRRLYVQKQQETLAARANLVEIDLLRGGVHTTLVPYHRARAKAGEFDYHVCVHAFDRADLFYVYPIQLREPLPAIAIPLLPNDPPVAIELSPLLARCYDSGRYATHVRYREWHPSPPFSPEQAAWVEQTLRSAGI